MIRSIPAEQLADGDVMALPFNRTATVAGAPVVGRRFVKFRTEYGVTRVERTSEVLLEVPDAVEVE